MTRKKAEPAAAKLDDLDVFHLYVRSLPPSGRLSGRAFERMQGFSDGHLGRSVSRLELQFGAYLLVKKVRKGDGADIERAEDVPKGSGKEPPRLINRDRLTAAGKVIAEMASLVVGYSVLARLAFGSPYNRPTDHANLMLAATLRVERRRLHALVMLARLPGSDLEKLGDRLDDAAFEYDPRDSLNMATQPLPRDEEPYETDL